MQSLSRRSLVIGLLLLILLLGGRLRLAKLGEVPPGLHVDEASRAWNAYTLLKTGKDQHGVSWPIFYSRAFGENPSAFYIYALLPFQAIGGMNVWTTRLPAAVGGLLTVVLIYFVGARLFGCATGLVAAAMLAFNPWHFQVSRWSTESALTPLLIMASLATLLWANMPFDDDEQRRPRPALAALAGAVTGISCYGHWTVRLFLPILLIGAVFVTWRAWWNRLKDRSWALAIAAMLIAGALTFGPFLWKHVTDPGVNKRAKMVGWVWNESDTLAKKVKKVLSRYPGHFGPEFLFISGDRFPSNSPPPGTGLFHWYDLPLMLGGVVVLVSRFKSSRAARVLLVWILLYPAADLLSRHVSLHSLRSLPGLCGLILLASVGAVSAGRWLWQRRRQTAVVILSVMALLIIKFNARFLNDFFGDDFYAQQYKFFLYGADILEAAQWLRPRLNEADAVFVTSRATRHPYIFSLVGLGYDPHQWFSDIREVVPGPLPNGAYKYEDVYLRYGKMHFMFNESGVDAIKGLLQNGRPDRVIFIIRPGEIRLEGRVSPVYEVRNPGGQPVLLVFDLYL